MEPVTDSPVGAWVDEGVLEVWFVIGDPIGAWIDEENAVGVLFVLAVAEDETAIF